MVCRATTARLSVLVPNLRGLERAARAGATEVAVVLSATDTMNRKNIAMDLSVATSTCVAVLQQASKLGLTSRAYVAVAFECPFEGLTSPARVIDLAVRMSDAGAGEIVLADTIGAGDPWAVTKKVEAARKAAPDAVLRLHFHDTRNTGLANAYAGVEAGVDVLDASVGGIGGCPFAPGATGNVATEDLVYMLERAGYSTGYDLDALIETARWIGDRIGRPAPSALSRAGGWPKG